jgi:hypothetical protein
MRSSSAGRRAPLLSATGSARPDEPAAFSPRIRRHSILAREQAKQRQPRLDIAAGVGIVCWPPAPAPVIDGAITCGIGQLTSGIARRVEAGQPMSRILTTPSCRAAIGRLDVAMDTPAAWAKVNPRAACRMQFAASLTENGPAA